MFFDIKKSREQKSLIENSWQAMNNGGRMGLKSFAMLISLN